jgi:hypothetical protein
MLIFGWILKWLRESLGSISSWAGQSGTDSLQIVPTRRIVAAKLDILWIHSDKHDREISEFSITAAAGFHVCTVWVRSFADGNVMVGKRSVWE